MVDDTPSHEKALNGFYREVLGDEAKGLKESLMNSWWVGGQLLPIGQIKLSIVRAWQELIGKLSWNWKFLGKKMAKKK